MATASTLTISGSRTGGDVEAGTIGTITLSNTDAPVAHTTQSFSAATFAAVTFPALIGSAVIKGVIIKPASTNTGAVTLKGITGDTGIPIHKTEATVLRFDSVTSSNFGMLCANACVVEFVWL